MPFDLDCADREPLAPDATAQLVQLVSIAEQLGADELGVVLTVAERRTRTPTKRFRCALGGLTDRRRRVA